MNNLLPSAHQAQHIAVWDEIWRDRLAAIPVEVVIPNLIDIVTPSALPVLAEQFDMLGLNGYALANTDEERRDLLRRAIQIHAKKGTPWSIKEALRLFGYPGAQFIEGIRATARFDGTYTFNGSITFGGGMIGWAVFDVVFPAAVFATFTAPDFDKIRAIIEAYKPVRCHLRRISVSLAFEETVTPSEELELQGDLTLEDEAAPTFNGRYRFDGSITFRGYSEDFNTTP